MHALDVLFTPTATVALQDDREGVLACPTHANGEHLIAFLGFPCCSRVEGLTQNAVEIMTGAICRARMCAWWYAGVDKSAVDKISNPFRGETAFRRYQRVSRDRTRKSQSNTENNAPGLPSSLCLGSPPVAVSMSE